MKRAFFVNTCFTAGTVLLSPFKNIAKSLKKFRENNGFLVGAGKGRFDKKISLFEGDTFTTKVSTIDTEGDIFVFESTRIKEGGPTHHYHFDQDEWWYVLQGQFLFKIGEKMFQANAGDSVFGPRMIPHSFAKVGEGEGKLLMFFQPAGKMEEFFTKISEGAVKGMTEEEQDKFRENHGFKRVGPPIKNFKKW
jgi:mannose-6-phosphate isomerase-like protein (cupin superfamily)